ncbi:MAG: DUF6702 family protein [Flavobacteriaceae bacterium]
MRSSLLLVFCTFFLLGSTTHKYYVSTTEIEYKIERNTIQITLQLFTDDAELMLQQKDPNVRLDPDFDAKKVDILLDSELSKALQLFADQSALELSFLGKEYKNDIVKCYLEVQLKDKIQELEIFNTVFFSLFEEQQNIIHFKGSVGRKSFLLHSRRPSVKIEL